MDPRIEDVERFLYEGKEQMPSVGKVAEALGITRGRVLTLCKELGELPVYDVASPGSPRPAWRVPRETARVLIRYLYMGQLARYREDGTLIGT